MTYLMDFEAITSIETACVAADKAMMLIQGLIDNRLVPCKGEYFDYYKEEIILHTNVVYDYIIEVADMLEELKDNGKIIEERTVVNES